LTPIATRLSSRDLLIILIVPLLKDNTDKYQIPLGGQGRMLYSPGGYQAFSLPTLPLKMHFLHYHSKSATIPLLYNWLALRNFCTHA
jgi:hypothetical protein